MAVRFLAICVAGAEAGVKVHALLSDHAVLQTSDDGGPGARISGTAHPSESVTLTLAGGHGGKKLFTAKASSDGQWVMHVNMTSGGPYEATVIGSKSRHSIVVKDLLFGDVYICSGQVISCFASCFSRKVFS